MPAQPRYIGELQKSIAAYEIKVDIKVTAIEERIKIIEARVAQVEAGQKLLIERTAIIQDIYEVLRGKGYETGIVSVITEQGKAIKKHEEVLFGETGIVKRFEKVEWVFTGSGKIIMALILAIVGTIGGAIGTLIAHNFFNLP